MSSAQKVLLACGLVCSVLIIALELGLNLFPAADAPSPEKIRAQLETQLSDEDKQNVDLDKLVSATLSKGRPPGTALPYMALLDGVLCFNVALMMLGAVLQQGVFARIQGIITLVFSLVIVIAGIVLIFIAIAQLLLMVGLLLAVPFGTLAYMVIWAFFDTSTSAIVLSTIMTLKIACAVLVAVSQPQFMRMVGFMVLIATTLVAVVLIGFLHGEIPGPLVSITDVIGAIVVAILAVVWAIVHLIGSISSVVKAVRI